jgi:LPXTG-motif cell wall-anchored protein
MRSMKILLTTALVCVLMSLGSVAFAQQPAGGSGPEVNPPGIEGETITPQTEDTSTESGTLPFTGADVTLFLVIGLSAIGAGTILVRRTRRAES